MSLFDFQSHQDAIPLQDKIDLAARSVSPEMDAAIAAIQRFPGLQGLEKSLLQPEADIRSILQRRTVSYSRQPARQTTVVPQELLRLEQPTRWSGRVGRKPGNETACLQQIEVAMAGRLRESGIPGHIRLIDQACGSIGREGHESLKIGKIRYSA